MPRHRRKSLSFTSDSLHRADTEDDNDYLLDPDQMYDVLPQPYRMINMILTHILDSVYDIAESKENAVLTEARKARPPRFDESLMLSLFTNATALGSCADDQYIFVGLPNGLEVFDVSTNSSVHSWKHERTEITSIKSYPLGSEYHLVIAQDDMATVRLFLFGCGSLFFIKVMNENLPESSTKLLCQKWEVSNGGEYAGFVFEETSTKGMWLEVHKLPVEEWVLDLDTIKNGPEDEVEDEEEINVPVREHRKSNVEGQIDLTTIQEKLSIKFSNPIPILKIKCPPALPLPGSTSPNIVSAVRKVDTGDVFGTGLNHLLDTNHLNSRDAMFKYRHESKMQYLPEEKDEQPASVTFHFANSSRFITSGLDLGVSDKVSTIIIVWWSGSPHLYHYSLLKSAKAFLEDTSNGDLESKPDAVWPFTSNIICSSISSCTSHLAVGLTNGNIILWDRQLGLSKGVLNAPVQGSLKSVRFLDSCLFPYTQPQYPPYPTLSATFLLVEYSDGTQHLFDTCHGTEQISRCVAEKPENDDDIQTLLQVIPDLPQLMIYVQKNGNMYIKDIGTGTAICQIALPPTHQIQTPWNPIFLIGGGGTVLYVKGEGTEVTENGSVRDSSGIFMFNLSFCPALGPYISQKYEKKELNVYITHEQRMTALMKERVQQQLQRKIHLQKRWTHLTAELNIIQQASEVQVPSMIAHSSLNSFRAWGDKTRRFSSVPE